jgi:O-antigen ligase
MDRLSRWCHRQSTLLLTVTVFAAPIPLGSNRDWSWSPLAIAIGLVGLLQAFGALFGRRQPAWPTTALLVPACAAVILVAWAFLQTDGSILGLSNSLVDRAYITLGLEASPRVATRPDAVFTGIMKWLVYFVAFWTAANAAQDIRVAKQLLVAMVAAGVAITLYALVAETAHALQGDITAIFPKIGVDFSGTFVNRNNYATYAGLATLIVVCLIRMRLPQSRRDGEPLRLRVRRLALGMGGATAMYAAAGTIVLGGLFLSGSRAGIVAFFGAVAVDWLLARRRSLWVPVTIAVVVAGSLMLPAGNQLIARFAGLMAVGDGDRTELYEMSLVGIALRPWTGWGLGSFDSVFFLLQPTALVKIFDKAHNTYLELIFDIGVIGLLLPCIVLWFAIRCAIGVQERQKYQEIPALGVSATAMVGIHSMFDFSLQIPAVALSFAVILGVGWAQSWSTRRREMQKQQTGL